MVSLQVIPHSQLIFPSKAWFFRVYLNFQQQKSLKNQYLPHSESKSYQINSIKSCSSRSFQQHQRHIPISLKFSAMILFYFQWKNHSIFKNFCTTSPNGMEPGPWTPPRWESPKTPRVRSEASWFGGSLKYKTNKLPSFIDRWHFPKFLYFGCSKKLKSHNFSKMCLVGMILEVYLMTFKMNVSTSYQTYHFKIICFLNLCSQQMMVELFALIIIFQMCIIYSN
jgi:hypothetical protein